MATADDYGMVAVPRSANDKTGDVIQGIVGRTMRETVASCSGCPLLPRGTSERYGIAPSRDESRGKPCYAHAGRVAMAAESARATPELRERGLGEAIEHRVDAGLPIVLRDGMIGDPGRRPLAVLEQEDLMVRIRGGSVLRYTHFWRERPELAHLALASCETLEEADQAIDMGFIPAVIIGASHASDTWVYTPAGRPILVCLHARMGIRCVDCRMCDPQHRVWREVVPELGRIIPRGIGLVELG